MRLTDAKRITWYWEREVSIAQRTRRGEPFVVNSITADSGLVLPSSATESELERISTMTILERFNPPAPELLEKVKAVHHWDARDREGKHFTFLRNSIGPEGWLVIDRWQRIMTTSTIDDIARWIDLDSVIVLRPTP